MNNNLIFFIIDKLTGNHIASVSLRGSAMVYALIRSAQQLIKKTWEEFAMTPHPSSVAFVQYLITRYPTTFVAAPEKMIEYQAYCTVLVDRNPKAIDASFEV
jgi:hypothetical protein